MSVQQRYDELRARVFQAEVGDEPTVQEMAELLTLDERLREQSRIRADLDRKAEEAKLRGVDRIRLALAGGSR